MRQPVVKWMKTLPAKKICKFAVDKLARANYNIAVVRKG